MDVVDHECLKFRLEQESWSEFLDFFESVFVFAFKLKFEKIVFCLDSLQNGGSEGRDGGGFIQTHFVADDVEAINQIDKKAEFVDEFDLRVLGEFYRPTDVLIPPEDLFYDDFLSVVLKNLDNSMRLDEIVVHFDDFLNQGAGHIAHNVLFQ